MTARQLIWIVVGAAVIWLGGRWIYEKAELPPSQTEIDGKARARFEETGRQGDIEMVKLKKSLEAANASAAQGY